MANSKAEPVNADMGHQNSHYRAVQNTQFRVIKTRIVIRKEQCEDLGHCCRMRTASIDQGHNQSPGGVRVGPQRAGQCMLRTRVESGIS